MSYNFTGDVYGGRNGCGCDDYDAYGGREGQAGEISCSYECGRNNGYDDLLVLAIATVPMQKWRLTYSPEKALCAGTMFAELNLPFKGGKCR